MKNLSPIGKKLLHYTTKALNDYKMIKRGDKVMLCLSGGKDSFTMVSLLHYLQKYRGYEMDLFLFTMDQGQPGWDDSGLRAWLEHRDIKYEVYKQDTYSIVVDKIPEGKTYCSLCSRLRRGNMYGYAERNGFTRVALGHHRDDMVRTLLMSILYNGKIKSMPPKLLSDNKKNVVIRPLALCQEADIIEFAKEEKFPIIPCNLCGSQENLMRVKVRKLIDDLAKENPSVPSNILHALKSVEPSQLMDHRWWNFRDLEIEDELPLDEAEHSST